MYFLVVDSKETGKFPQILGELRSPGHEILQTRFKLSIQSNKLFPRNMVNRVQNTNQKYWHVIFSSQKFLFNGINETCSRGTKGEFPGKLQYRELPEREDQDSPKYPPFQMGGYLGNLENREFPCISLFPGNREYATKVYLLDHLWMEKK